MRVGQGYDVHRLTEGRELILGGVNIPYEKGLDGHSDADVLVHAVMDALLGAAALGDIGEHFPDSDPRYKGASSIELLRHVGRLLENEGYVIENIDSTIIAQRPKLLAYRPKMAENIADALGLSKDQVLGLGVGVPGPVRRDGVVDRCANLGWGTFHLEEALSQLLALPVKAGNDANVAALGECWQGGGRGYGSMILVTLGTGIGGGIVVDGKILTGAHGAGGEISHMPMQKDETEVCGCGKRGCAEQYGSANGILRLARRRMERSNLPSPLRGMEPLTCKDIFDLSAQGDPLAREIQEEYFDFLGQFLADVCCVIDPEAVLLGGGVSKAGQPLLDGVRKYFLSYMFHTGQDIFFALAKLGNDAGIYGSFKLALDAFGR